MIKLLGRLLIVVVVAGAISWGVTWGLQKINSTLITDAVTTWANIWQAVSAFGAILMVVYGEDVKSAVHMPSLTVRVSRESPLSCKVGRKDPKEDKDSSAVLEIYAEVLNKSVCAAESCQVVADSILASTEDKNYTIQAEFCQTPFRFMPDDVTESRIPQAIKRYLIIASIVENISESTTSGETVATASVAELRIAIQDRSKNTRYTKIDSRMHHVLIPVSIVAAGCPATRKVLYIHWSGNSIAECSNPSLYNVEMKNPHDVASLLDKGVDKSRIGA